MKHGGGVDTSNPFTAASYTTETNTVHSLELPKQHYKLSGPSLYKHTTSLEPYLADRTDGDPHTV